MAASRRPTFIFIAILIFLFVFGSSLLGFYTEWLWFKSLGYASVFLRLLNYKFMLALVLGLSSGILFYLNGRLLFRLARQTPPAGPVRFPLNVPLWLEEHLPRLLKPAAIVIGVLFGLGAAGQWENFQLFRYTPAGWECGPRVSEGPFLLPVPSPLLEFSERLVRQFVVCRAAHGGFYYSGPLPVSILRPGDQLSALG